MALDPRPILPRCAPCERARRTPVLGVELEGVPGASATDEERLQWADALIRAVWPEATEAARQIVGGIGWAESCFGIVAKRCPQFAPAGSPSFNWGAVTAGWVKLHAPELLAGTFGGGDLDANGKPIAQTWARFASARDGLEAFIRGWTRVSRDPGYAAKMVAAAQDGDAYTVAKLMKQVGYYTGTSGTTEDRIRAYASMIVGHARTMAKANGQALAVRASGSSSSSGPPSPVQPVPPTPPASMPGSANAVAFAAFAGLGLIAMRALR